MASTTNPLVNQPVAQEITAAEVTYFLADVLKQTSDQFRPGKLVINGANGDVLQRWVRENNPPAVPVVKTLLESRNYAQAVTTLVSEYTRAVRALMFDVPSRLEWEVVHPAITKRGQLERGEKPMTDDQGRAKIVAATEQAKADDANAKLEAKLEREVNDLIERICFINPRYQTRDERKIQDLKTELRGYVAKARKSGRLFATYEKNGTKVHGIYDGVRGQIFAAYRADEKQRERWNSR